LGNPFKEQQMKKFLAIYIGTAARRAQAGWDAMDAAKRAELEAAGIRAWHEWMAANEASIVDSGGPLGKTKRVSAVGIADTTNPMAGYVILEAESHEAAARKFEGHPHFTILPGDSVEIMECMPVPGA
jgi:hypothetical protein